MESYIEIHPKDRDDLMEKTINLFKVVSFIHLKLVTLYNSGMGSGKTKIMEKIPCILKDFHGIVFLCEKNQHLLSQIILAFEKFNNEKYQIIKPSQDNKYISEIRTALILKKIPLILIQNINHRNGSINKYAHFIDYIALSFPSEDKLMLIDEIDNQLTSLTGGINAKLDHTRGIIESYIKVLSQGDESLNIFDTLREKNIKCIGFSGTMNNMVSSKLVSTGYNKEDISIINIYPIESLYKNLRIKKMNVHLFENIKPYLEEIEQFDDKKCLIAVPDEKSIESLKKEYKKTFNKEMSYVKITGSNQTYRNSGDFKKDLKNAKFVFGINIITTGFDISTWVADQQFALGILYRKLSDKISQPLSKNEDHDLHMDSAASILQLLARLRIGGFFLIPSNLDDRPLFDRLKDVFEIIKDGKDQYDWLGGSAKSKQEDRFHQSLVIALIQNIKENNRPIVTGILDDLKTISRRDFENEVENNKDNPSLFDHEFWTETIRCLWKTFSVDHDPDIIEEEKDNRKFDIINNYRRTIITTSGGLRNTRTQNEKIMDEVAKRSENTCGHCGFVFETTEVPQNCHIKRCHEDGEATLDNIMRGHSGCDSIYDNDDMIIYDLDKKGVWLGQRVSTFNPHKKQLTGISFENIKARWDWQKNKQGLSEVSDDDYREYLRNKNYIYKIY